MDKKEYFLYVKGKAVKVNEAIYRAYWKMTEHEKYLQRKDWKYKVLPSALTVPQCNQCLCDLSHLLISARASSPTVSLPVGRVLLTWHATLIGPGFAQSIRAFGPTVDNYRGYPSASGHCLGQLFCIVASPASGDDSTHIFSFFAF